MDIAKNLAQNSDLKAGQALLSWGKKLKAKELEKISVFLEGMKNHLPAKAWDAVVKHLKSKDESIRILALEALLALDAEKALALLKKMDKDLTKKMRLALIDAVSQTGEKGAIDFLIRMLGSADPQVVYLALKRLHGITNQQMEADINKWISWWDKNEATFKMPEPKGTVPEAPVRTFGYGQARCFELPLVGRRIAYIVGFTDTKNRDLIVAEIKQGLSLLEKDTAVVILPIGSDLGKFKFQSPAKVRPSQIVSSLQATEPNGASPALAWRAALELKPDLVIMILAGANEMNWKEEASDLYKEFTTTSTSAVVNTIGIGVKPRLVGWLEKLAGEHQGDHNLVTD